LKHLSTWGIFYSISAKQTFFHGWTNVDWVGDLEFRKSTSRYVFLLVGGAISWQSKKQATIAFSSIESEYISIALTTKEAMWLCQSFNDLKFPQSKPLSLHCDNQSYITLTLNPQFHDHTKHNEIRYHFL
jgi:hypothetical protein